MPMDPREIALLIFIELTKQAGWAHGNLCFVANPNDLSDLTLVNLDGIFDVEEIGRAIAQHFTRVEFGRAA